MPWWKGPTLLEALDNLTASEPLEGRPLRFAIQDVYRFDDRRILAGRIESGICHVNGPTVHDEAQMPFGGVKDSGYGRFGGKAGIEAFTELRWITIQTADRHYPF